MYMNIVNPDIPGTFTFYILPMKNDETIATEMPTVHRLCGPTTLLRQGQPNCWKETKIEPAQN